MRLDQLEDTLQIGHPLSSNKHSLNCLISDTVCQTIESLSKTVVGKHIDII